MCAEEGGKEKGGQRERKMEMGRKPGKGKEQERMNRLSNDKWRPQDCASDIQLARPSPFCSSFSYTSDPRSFLPTLTTSGAGRTVCGFVLYTARKPRGESAFCWHLISKVQTIVPVGFTHRPVLAFLELTLYLAVYQFILRCWLGRKRPPDDILAKWKKGGFDCSGLFRREWFTCYRQYFIWNIDRIEHYLMRRATDNADEILPLMEAKRGFLLVTAQRELFL